MIPESNDSHADWQNRILNARRTVEVMPVDTTSE